MEYELNLLDYERIMLELNTNGNSMEYVGMQVEYVGLGT